MITIIIDENTLKAISIIVILLIFFILTGYIWYLKTELMDLKYKNDFLEQNLTFYQELVDKLHHENKHEKQKEEL